MDLILKGRGLHVTDQIRRVVERGAARLEGPRRPAVGRLEVEIVEEATPRIGGGHRVHLTCRTARRTFRSEASGTTIDAALDAALDRLERQIETYRSKREDRVTRGAASSVPPAVAEGTGV